MSTNGPAGELERCDCQAVAPLGFVTDVGRRRIIHEIGLAPSCSRSAPTNPGVDEPNLVLRERVTEMLPFHQIGERATCMLIQPVAKKLLGAIGVIVRPAPGTGSGNLVRVPVWRNHLWPVATAGRLQSRNRTPRILMKCAWNSRTRRPLQVRAALLLVTCDPDGTIQRKAYREALKVRFPAHCRHSRLPALGQEGVLDGPLKCANLR